MDPGEHTFETCKFGGVFEKWPVQFTPEPWRVVDPPQQVVVAAHLAIATKPKYFRQDQLAMRVKLGGLRLADNVPGWLHAWVLLASLHFVNAVLRECVLLSASDRIRRRCGAAREMPISAATCAIGRVRQRSSSRLRPSGVSGAFSVAAPAWFLVNRGTWARSHALRLSARTW